MKYILDTNAVSAAMKGDERIISRLEKVSWAAVAVPQPVLAEIAYGIERLPKSKKKDTLRNKFETLRAALVPASWSERVTDAFGNIKAALERKGQRIEDFDAAIAAHAVAENATLVTADITDMSRVPGILLEDWSAS
jgi:tRNA(fMet)-specific endonuclease VapC